MLLSIRSFLSPPLVSALGFEPAAVVCEPVSPAPLDGLPLADSTRTDAASVCALQLYLLLGGCGRPFLLFHTPVFAAAAWTASAATNCECEGGEGGEGQGEGEGGGCEACRMCEGKGEHGGDGHISTRGTLRVVAAARNAPGLRCEVNGIVTGVPRMSWSS